MTTNYCWIPEPIFGFFITRLNRFTCLINIANEEVLAYLPNTGRMTDLLIPGNKIILSHSRSTGKTQFDLKLIETNSHLDDKPIWVATDSRLPSLLFRWMLEQQLLADCKSPVKLIPEYRIADSRFDFMVETKTDQHIIELKSVNYVDENGVAKFPDAPTLRGVKHIFGLMELIPEFQPWIIFIIMRSDAIQFAPNETIDILFADTLTKAVKSGVNIRAYKFSVGTNCEFLGPLPVIFPF